MSSQVLGSALSYAQMFGEEAVVKIAAVTKLTRNLFLALVIPGPLQFKVVDSRQYINNFPGWRSIQALLIGHAQVHKTLNSLPSHHTHTRTLDNVE